MGPSMHTVLLKVLSYAEECQEAGVEADVAVARDLAGVNRRYFANVMEEALKKGFIDGLYVPDYIDRAVPPLFGTYRLTLDGAEFLESDSKMRQARDIASHSVRAAIEAAVCATVRSAMGL